MRTAHDRLKVCAEFGMHPKTAAMVTGLPVAFVNWVAIDTGMFRKEARKTAQVKVLKAEVAKIRANIAKEFGS